MHLQKCFVNIKDVISEKSLYKNFKILSKWIVPTILCESQFRSTKLYMKNIKNFYELRIDISLNTLEQKQGVHRYNRPN